MKHLDLIKGLFSHFGIPWHKVVQKDEYIVLAKDFMFEELLDRGMQPEKEVDGILFHYRGGNFRVKWLGKRIVRFVYPFLYTSDYDSINRLHRAVNMINSHYMVCKLVVLTNPEDASVSVHAVADLYYTSQNNMTPILENMLDQFFEMHHELLLNLKEAINSCVFDCASNAEYQFSLN